MSSRSQDFECSVKRIIPGQATGIPGTFRIQGSQLQWAPQNSANGQSFKVALEAITGDSLTDSAKINPHRLTEQTRLYPECCQKICRSEADDYWSTTVDRESRQANAGIEQIRNSS